MQCGPCGPIPGRMKKCRAGAARKSWPGARIGHEGFVRAGGPEEVTKRVRAARRAEGHEGPGVNRLLPVIPSGCRPSAD